MVTVVPLLSSVLRDGDNSPITTMMLIKFTNGPITSISEFCLRDPEEKSGRSRRGHYLPAFNSFLELVCNVAVGGESLNINWYSQPELQRYN